MQSSNLKNHIGSSQYGIDFSNYTFHRDVANSQARVQTSVETILNSQRLVIYKNKKGHLFYVLWGIKEENGIQTRRISQVTSAKGFHTLTQKERLLIEADLNNNTQVCALQPVQDVEYKPVLNKIVETHHREKQIMNMNGTFSYKNSAGSLIQVEIEKGKITSAIQGTTQVSLQQKAAIQKMILMGRFEKFHNIQLQAANDEVYFEDASQQKEPVVQTQTQTSQSVEDILNSSEVQNDEKVIPEVEYPNMKGVKEVLGKKKPTQKAQETPEESQPKRDPKLQAYYQKILSTYKHLQIVEERFFEKNMSGVTGKNISHIQLFAVVDFVEQVAKEYGVAFDKSFLRDEVLRNKFFKKLFSLFHPDKEKHPEAKEIKKEIMQSLQHIKENYLELGDLSILFPQKTAKGYNSSTSNNSSFRAKA